MAGRTDSACYVRQGTLPQLGAQYYGEAFGRPVIMPFRDLFKKKPQAPKQPSDLPPEVSSKLDPNRPAHEYYNFGSISGDQDGPTGEQGAYAIAHGKSGDASRHPLPSDPKNPKAVFVPNGFAGMVKSIGPDSIMIDVPGVGLYHFRRQDVTELKPEGERVSPLAARPKLLMQPPVEVSKPELVEDLYDPSLKPAPKRRGSICVRAKQSQDSSSLQGFGNGSSGDAHLIGDSLKRPATSSKRSSTLDVPRNRSTNRTSNRDTASQKGELHSSWSDTSPRSDLLLRPEIDRVQTNAVGNVPLRISGSLLIRSDATTSKRMANSTRNEPELTIDRQERKPIRVKAQSSRQVPREAPLDVVMSRVITGQDDLQVVDGVVQPVLVKMMNVLRAGQDPVQVPLHNNSMLRPILSRTRAVNIPVRFAARSVDLNVAGTGLGTSARSGWQSQPESLERRSQRGLGNTLSLCGPADALALLRPLNRSAKGVGLDGPSGLHSSSLPHNVRLQLLGQVRGMDIVLVDGEMVRDHIFIDFTMGGNPARYPWVPPKEVWIDKNLRDNPEDIVATIIHEVAEYHRMTNRGESYNDAHERAAELETQFRGGLVEDECERASPIDIATEFLDRHESETNAKLDEYKDNSERKTYASIRVRAGLLEIPPKMREAAHAMLEHYRGVHKNDEAESAVREKEKIVEKVKQVRERAAKFVQDPRLPTKAFADLRTGAYPNGRFDYPATRTGETMVWLERAPQSSGPDPRSLKTPDEWAPIEIRRVTNYVSTSVSLNRSPSAPTQHTNSKDFKFDTWDEFITWLRADIERYADENMSSASHLQDIEDAKKKFTDRKHPGLRYPIKNDEAAAIYELKTNLEGWRYAGKVDPMRVPSMLILAFHVRKDPEAGGFFRQPRPGDLGTIEVFNSLGEGARDTLDHELAHATQIWLGRGRGFGNSWLGTPKRPQTDEKREKQHKELPHELRDVEYQPRLRDEIHTYRNSYGFYDPAEYLKESPWFIELKANNVQRWREAVREFYKAVKERPANVEFPKRQYSIRVRANDLPAVDELPWRSYNISLEALGGETRHADARYPQFVDPELMTGMGYFDGLPAEDGDSLDVIVGNDEEGLQDGPVYVIEQLNAQTGEHQQEKVMLGFAHESDAMEAFLALWPEKMLGSIKSMSADDFEAKMLPKLVVEKTAAGLVQLHGLDDLLASRVARAAVKAMKDIGIDRQKGSMEEVAQRVQAELGLHSLSEYMGASGTEILGEAKAAELFGAIRFFVIPTFPKNPKALAWFSDNTNSIGVALGVLLDRKGVKDSIPRSSDLSAELQSVLAHELRHAADWAHKEASTPGEWKRQNPEPSLQDPQREEKYVNLPSERVSYAGNMADIVWRRWGPDYKNLSGRDLIESMESIFPKLMQNLRPENRKKFLQRVMNELDKKYEQAKPGLQAPRSASIRVRAGKPTDPENKPKGRAFSTPEAERAFEHRQDEWPDYLGEKLKGTKIIVKAGKPKYCSHCKKNAPEGEFFGAEGRWLHRSCTKHGPVDHNHKYASIRVRSQHGNAAEARSMLDRGYDFIVLPPESTTPFYAKAADVDRLMQRYGEGLQVMPLKEYLGHSSNPGEKVAILYDINDPAHTWRAGEKITWVGQRSFDSNRQHIEPGVWTLQTDESSPSARLVNDASETRSLSWDDLENFVAEGYANPGEASKEGPENALTWRELGGEPQPPKLSLVPNESPKKKGLLVRARRPPTAQHLQYPWHDESGMHMEADEHPHTSVPEPPIKNDQVVQRGESAGDLYRDIAKDYGSLERGRQTNLKYYDYRAHEPKIDDLVKQHGYQTYYAGGKYGKPDLANKNYNTGHLMVYDPTPGQGGDFDDEATTRSWRKIHELSHGLSYKDLNAKYGEGRRIGKLGTHRTLREAKRAVEWEWMTVMKQRELSEQVGHPIDDKTFAREVNTVMHDAVHRAITGKFTNPDEEGFEPSDKIVPLEVSLKKLEEAAKKMGLKEEDATLQKGTRNASVRVRAQESQLPTRNEARPSARPEKRDLELEHYSTQSGLTEIDPAHIGTGSLSNREKNDTGVPVSFYYMKGTEPETLVTSRSRSRYETSVPADKKIYDLGKDPENFGRYAREGRSALYGAMKDAGYYGFYNSESALPNAVALFYKHPAKEVQQLRSASVRVTAAPPREKDDGRLDYDDPAYGYRSQPKWMKSKDLPSTKEDEKAKRDSDKETSDLPADDDFDWSSGEEAPTVPDPVFEPGTPWHLRHTDQGLRDVFRNKQVKPGEPPPPEPEVQTSGEENRKKIEEKLFKMLSPAQQERVKEMKRAPSPEKPADRYIADRKVPDPSTKKVEDFGVKPNGGLQNILNVLSHARPDEIEYWQEWYKHARADAKAIGDKYDVPESLAAGLIAILSPNTKWEENVFAAEQMLKGQGKKVIDYRGQLDPETEKDLALKIYPSLFEGKKETLGSGSYLKNIIKAQRMLDTYRAQHDLTGKGAKEGYEPDIAQPVKLEWDDPESRAKAEEEFNRLRYRGWTARKVKYVTDSKPKKKKDKATGKVTTTPPTWKSKYSWQRGEEIPANGPFPWSESRLIMLPPFFDADAPAKAGKNKGHEKSPPKVTAFYNSIMRPEKHQNTVVLDGHAINIWRGIPANLSELKKNAPSTDVREKMIADYKKAADESTKVLHERVKALKAFAKKTQDPERRAHLEEEADRLSKVKKLTPQQIQAITWTVWRDAVKNGGGRSDADEDIESADEGDEDEGESKEASVQTSVRVGWLRNDHVERRESDHAVLVEDRLGDHLLVEQVGHRSAGAIDVLDRGSAALQAADDVLDRAGSIVEQNVDDLRAQRSGVHATSMRLRVGGSQVSVRIGKQIKTSPDKSPSTFKTEEADKAFRFDGPTYTEDGKKKRKTPGAVNDGSTGRQTGIQTDSGPGGGVGSGGGMGASASIRLGAIDRLILRRSGFKTYEGAYNGKKVRVQAEELVERGSYPGNRRQKRSSIWKVAIDGMPVGEARSFREARAMAFEACMGPQPQRTAGVISVMDTEGQEHTTYIEQVKPGDRVRFKRNYTGKAKGGNVEIEGGMLAEVQAVNPAAPSLTVFVRGVQRGDRGKEVRIGRHSVEVPAEELWVILPGEDPRVASLAS